MNQQHALSGHFGTTDLQEYFTRYAVESRQFHRGCGTIFRGQTKAELLAFFCSPGIPESRI